MSTTSSRPSHRLYIVEDRGGEPGSEQNAFWHRVGAAWPQKDGKGLSIQLIPGVAVSGRLVLREYTVEQEEADTKSKRAKSK